MSETSSLILEDDKINNPHTQALPTGSFFEKQRTVDDAWGLITCSKYQQKP
jgi:hypothetical protein